MNVWMRRFIVALPWLVIAALSCGITMIVLFPAAWVTPQFARQTQGHVNLVEPAGSLWHGSATLVLAAGTEVGGATQLPGRIEWHTAFWPLLTGRLRMRMRQTDAMPDAVNVDATPGGALLSGGSIAVPAALLSGLGAPFNTLDLQGDVRMSWTDWRVLNGRAFGQLTMTLTDMISRVSPVKPLGSYSVVLQSQGKASTIDLSTLKGPLMLSGHGTVSGEGTTFHGEASATSEARDNLAGLLNLLGRPTGDGVIALDYERGGVQGAQSTPGAFSAQVVPSTQSVQSATSPQSSEGAQNAQNAQNENAPSPQNAPPGPQNPPGAQNAPAPQNPPGPPGGGPAPPDFVPHSHAGLPH
jgi:general secretion pathway protein N